MFLKKLITLIKKYIMEKKIFTKAISLIAITIVIICSIFAIQACEKRNYQQVTFYSDFYLVNCSVDSVAIYIDDSYVGKLTESYIPGSQQVGAKNSKNILKARVTKGKHTYTAKINGECNIYWVGDLDVTTDLEINLKVSEAKPIKK
jgi:hypothetical protein